MTLLQDRIAVAATRFFHSLCLENEVDDEKNLFESQKLTTSSKNVEKLFA